MPRPSRVVFAAVLVAACSVPPDPEALRDELMQADRAFAAATAERGSDGWVSWFAEDGRQIPAGRPIIEGHQAIREAMSPMLDNPANRLSWEPRYAEVSAGGDLGYTVGEADGWVVSPSGDTTALRSRYVTIWRRGADGSWKVALDLGVEREPAN